MHFVGFKKVKFTSAYSHQITTDILLSPMNTLHLHNSFSANQKRVIFSCIFINREIRLSLSNFARTLNGMYEINFIVYRDIREVNEKYFQWGECDDMNDDCQQWAKQGLCQKDSEKMNEMCPWSCHKCAPMKLGKYRAVVLNNLIPGGFHSFEIMIASVLLISAL